jgi:predicted PurR-regulated permease PerM
MSLGSAEPEKTPPSMGFGRWCGFAALVAAVVLLWDLREVLIGLFGSIVLAVAFCTLVEWMQQRLQIRRWQSLLLSLMLVIITVLVIITALVPPFLDQFQQLLRQLPKAANALSRLAADGIGQLSGLVHGQGAEPEAWSALLNDPSRWGLGSGVGKVLELAGNLGVGVLQLLFVVAVALMLSVQPREYRHVAIQLAPSFLRRRMAEVLDACASALSSWMVGVLISSLCVAVLAFIGLSMLGVELTTANALLAGMLNVIPNVGPTLSTIFPMSVALLDAPWKALAVLVFYVVIQNVESYLITPSVMHHQVRLLPGLTLTAQVIFTVIFGPVGLLLALPLAVCLQVLIREFVIRDLMDPWQRPRRFLQ